MCQDEAADDDGVSQVSLEMEGGELGDVIFMGLEMIEINQGRGISYWGYSSCRCGASKRCVDLQAAWKLEGVVLGYSVSDL